MARARRPPATLSTGPAQVVGPTCRTVHATTEYTPSVRIGLSYLPQQSGAKSLSYVQEPVTIMYPSPRSAIRLNTQEV